MVNGTDQNGITIVNFIITTGNNCLCVTDDKRYQHIPLKLQVLQRDIQILILIIYIQFNNSILPSIRRYRDSTLSSPDAFIRERL